jgi:small subunit ribosomal protein S21
MPKIGGITHSAKTHLRVETAADGAAGRVYDAIRCGHDEARISRPRPSAKGVTSTMETRVGPNESIESALKRFKKMCQKSGVLAEARRHEHYEKPSVRRKKKSAAARKRRS